MDYNLAKKLKDAGFPEIRYVINFEQDWKYWSPSLSELIEACGDGFLQLYRHYEPVGKMDGEWVFVDWRAYPRPATLKADGYVGYTLEEAVANLWLALNKK